MKPTVSTAAPLRSRPRSSRASRARAALRAVALLLLAAALLIGALAAVELEPSGGPAHRLIDAIEQRIGESDALHYYAHRVLGRVFSLCSCTAGLSREQYRKADRHRPG